MICILSLSCPRLHPPSPPWLPPCLTFKEHANVDTEGTCILLFSWPLRVRHDPHLSGPCAWRTGLDQHIHLTPRQRPSKGLELSWFQPLTSCLCLGFSRWGYTLNSRHLRVSPTTGKKVVFSFNRWWQADRSKSLFSRSLSVMHMQRRKGVVHLGSRQCEWVKGCSKPPIYFKGSYLGFFLALFRADFKHSF